MRRLVYLIVLLILLLAGGEFMRKYNIANLVSGRDDSIENSVISEYLAGTVAERSGDYKAATRYFEKALESDPENSQIISRLYALYLFSGDHQKAIEHAKREYELDKTRPKAQRRQFPIAYLLVALDAFKNKHTDRVPIILKSYARKGFKPKTHIDGVVIPMVLAWSHAVNEDYTDSFKVIDGITSKYMQSVFSYNRALINDLANNKEVKIDGKTYSLYDKGRKFLAEVFFEIGQFSLQNANMEESVIYYQLARYLDPESNKFKKSLGFAYEAMGKLQQAVDVYYEIPQSSPLYPEVLTNIALAQHNLGDNQRSIETLQKLSELDGYKSQALLGIGTIKMTEGQYHDAVKYFEEAKALIITPSKENWGVYFNLGVAYDRIDDWKRAEDNLRKAVETNPENPESLNYLAYSWLVKNQNIGQARKMLEAAVIRSGGAPHILDSYGWALYKLGYYKEALPFLEQAAISMPHSTVINDHLGDLYLKLNRKREARFQWKKALQGFDKDEDITPEITKEQIKAKLNADG